MFCPDKWGSFEPFMCQDGKDNLLPIRFVMFCVSHGEGASKHMHCIRDAVVLDEKKRGRMDYMD